MKNNKLIIAILLVIASFFGCDEEVSNQMITDYPQDFVIEYGLRQVIQYDPMNINGIDVLKKLNFFSTLRFTIQYEGGKITKVTYSNGDVPFSPFSFDAEASFEADAELDYDVFPNELRVRGTDNVIAYFQNGEFIMPFHLDCGSINYRYTFTNVE